MEIKFLLLKSEKTRVINFLNKFHLRYDSDITETLYVEENEEIIATISKAEYIIKCLAVDPLHQQENLASKLISEMILLLASQNKYYYQVFTKLEYIKQFTLMNFMLLATSEKVAFLEGGTPTISEVLEKLKKKLRLEYGPDFFNQDIGSIVVNCNPVTKGHLQLIEHISRLHTYVIVFLLEEDISYFTYQERYSMLYLATRTLTNVIILPSTRYIISKETFPNYFLKNLDEHAKEYATIDGKIFKDYFMKALNIKKRYVGSESNELMKLYNQSLKEALGNNLIEVERYLDNGKVISATLVRKYLEDKKIEDAMQLVPKCIENLLVLITNGKK